MKNILVLSTLILSTTVNANTVILCVNKMTDSSNSPEEHIGYVINNKNELIKISKKFEERENKKSAIYKIIDTKTSPNTTQWSYVGKNHEGSDIYGKLELTSRFGIDITDNTLIRIPTKQDKFTHIFKQSDLSFLWRCGQHSFTESEINQLFKP